MVAIPLPRVVGDTPEGGWVMSGLRSANALTTQNLENAIRKVQAQYAPYTQYADAASKIAYANMLPYQIQSTIMSNPMMWMALKDNPGAMQAMVDNLRNLAPQTNSLMSNPNMPPAPGNMPSNSASGGLINSLLSLFNGNKSNENATAPGNMPTGTEFGAANQAPQSMVHDVAQKGNQAYQNPLLPQEPGGKMTAQYTVSPYGAGALIPDPNNPGKAISVPTAKTSSVIQQQLIAAKRVEPQLERLANEWAPFMNLKGYKDLFEQKAGNFLNMTTLGDKDLPSKYAKAKATTLTAPESLLKSYGLNATGENLDRLQQVIEPQFGETKESYKARIKQQLEEIKSEQVGQSEEALSSGFSLGGKNEKAPESIPEPKNDEIKKKNDMLEGQMPPPGTRWMIRPDGLQVPVHESNIPLAISKYKYKKVE